MIIRAWSTPGCGGSTAKHSILFAPDGRREWKLCSRGVVITALELTRLGDVQVHAVTFLHLELAEQFFVERRDPAFLVREVVNIGVPV